MKKKFAAITLASLFAVSAPAFAIGGPNSAGNSGHFHPHSNPCQGMNDHPNCPGPH